MRTSKSTMLSTIKKVALFTLLLVLLLIPSNEILAKNKSTNKTSSKKITATKKTTKKKVKKTSTKKKKKKSSKKSKSLDWEKDKKVIYAKNNIIIYSDTDTSSNKISTYITNDKIKVLAKSSNSKWYKVRYKARTRYITTANDTSKKKLKNAYKGKRLTQSAGVCNGPSGRETYYNMRMNGVISIMRNKGYSVSTHPYWIRDDGCKMLGKYIMIACNLKLRPKGTLVETSLGTGIVCDTGGFAYRNPRGIDIAVNWGRLE